MIVGEVGPRKLTYAAYLPCYCGRNALNTTGTLSELRYLLAEETRREGKGRIALSDFRIGPAGDHM
jgi:hypothetical protein